LAVRTTQQGSGSGITANSRDAMEFPLRAAPGLEPTIWSQCPRASLAGGAASISVTIGISRGTAVAVAVDTQPAARTDISALTTVVRVAREVNRVFTNARTAGHTPVTTYPAARFAGWECYIQGFGFGRAGRTLGSCTRNFVTFIMIEVIVLCPRVPNKP
jgi:hypothetical protein